MEEIRFENEEINKILEKKTGKEKFNEEDIKRNLKWRKD
jgi:hypothetical protein